MSDQTNTNNTKKEAQTRGTKNRAKADDKTIITSPAYQMKHNYILAIAVDRYEDKDIPNLKNCLNDIEDILEVLTNDYFFSKDNVRYLRSRNTTDKTEQELKIRDERYAGLVDDANHKNIMDQLKYFAKNMTPQDNLIICFSGHGTYDEDFDEGYWIPSNGVNKDISSYIENATIRTALNAIDTHHTVLISDSCYSGTLFSTKQNRSLEAPRIYQQASRWGITAGRKEPVSDGTLGDNSPFAKELLRALREKREIWIAELINNIIKKVTDEKNEKQTPVGEALSLIKGHQNGQFVFFPKKVREIDYWRDAWRENTRKAYYNFLARYPDGEFEEIALAALNTFAADKKPLNAEAIIKTYDFIKEHTSSDFAKEQLKLYVSPKAEELKFQPLTESTKAAYLFLLGNIAKKDTQRYIRSCIYGAVLNEKDKVQYKGIDEDRVALRPASHTNEDVQATFHYLSEKFEARVASSYLKNFAFGKTTNTIRWSEETALILEYFKEFHAETVTRRIEAYLVDGKNYTLFSKEEKDTHVFLLQHSTKHPVKYIASINAYTLQKYLTPTGSIAFSPEDMDSYVFLKEQDNQYLEEYFNLVINSKKKGRERPLPLDQSKKDTYLKLKKISQEIASMYLEEVYRKQTYWKNDNHELMDAFDQIAEKDILLARHFLHAFLVEKNKAAFTEQAAKAFLVIKQKHPEYPSPKDMCNIYIDAFGMTSLYGNPHLKHKELDLYQFLRQHIRPAANPFLLASYKVLGGKKHLINNFDSLVDYIGELANEYLLCSIRRLDKFVDKALSEADEKLIQSYGVFIKKHPKGEKEGEIRNQMRRLALGMPMSPLSEV